MTSCEDFQFLWRDDSPRCDVDYRDYERIPVFKIGRSGPYHGEGKASIESETSPADPPAEQDIVVPSPQDPHDRYWTDDLLTRIFAFASLREVVNAPLLRKSLRYIFRFGDFRETRARRYLIEPNSLAPVLFYKRNGTSYLGYDSSDTNTWTTMPALRCLFSSDTKSVSAHVGLLCEFVEGTSGARVHSVYNPLTRKQRLLPPMTFPGIPFVTNLHVSVAENRYQVIAIGSQASGTHPRKTEIYDSKSKEWTVMDLPQGYIIENQTGVYREGHLYVIRSSGPYTRKEIMVLNMKKGWLDPIALPSPSAFPTTVQLLQCNNEIYVFFHDVSVLEITHCIYRLNHESKGRYSWTKKVTDKFKKKDAFSQAKYTCVAVKGNQGTKLGIIKNESCTVNAVTESICRVYDIPEDVTEITAASQIAVLFHPENRVGYSFEPSFFVDV